MKKVIFTLTTIFLSISAFAQITLEQVYPNASFKTGRQFQIVNLGNENHKYLLTDLGNSTFTFYNLNHSIYLTATIPVVWSNNNYKVQYFSNTLFDCDSSNIEYMLVYNKCTVYPDCIQYISVYRTDGTLLFSEDSVRALNISGGPTINRNYIVNTPNGTKLILDHEDSTVRVFGLCDILPTNYTQLKMDNGMVNSFPNPSRDYAIINYSLPNDVNNGTIVFYDIEGREIKRFNVDRSFDHLRVSTEDFASGTYYYNLHTSNGISSGKKLVTIK